MRNLAVYLRPYRKESVLAPLFKLLEVVFDLLVPIVVAQMIDVGVTNNDRPYIVVCFLILLLMAAVGMGCSFTAQFFAAKASVGFAASLRQAVFDHIQTLSFTELDTIGSDTLITRLTDDVNQVQNGLNMGLRLLLRSPFIVLGAMVMAFTINARCAVVFAVSIPVLLAVTFFIMLVSIPLFKKAQTGLDRVTGLTRENLTGVRVIRAFRREAQSVEEFEASNRALTKLNEFVGRISALLNPLTYVLINLATVFLIDQAAVQVNLGSMQQGQVVALYNYMLQIIVELIKLASLIITLNKSMACAERVGGVLQVRPSMQYPAESAAADSESEDAVQFQNVTFTYKGAGAPSLSDISFTVKKADMELAQKLLEENRDSIQFDHIDVSDNIAKVSIVGAGMVNSPGVAAAMFEALFNAGININMISTSEIKVSVLVHISDADRAVQVIHQRFYDEFEGAR